MRKIPWLHLVLFFLTFLSTLTMGAIYQEVNVFENPLQMYKGLPFSVTILIILLSHELSHYLASRKHHVDATLPYFLPAPTLFGTLGAFIKIKSPIQTRDALIDIGASGPIAGFIFSVFAAFGGLFFSSIVPLERAGEVIILGDSLLFSFLSKMVLGPVPANHDVFLHPVALAGWIGFFVTSLNLIPVGQLDGGHILYALIGDKHVNVSKVLLGVLGGLGLLFWEGWIVWAVLLLFLGFRHPPIMYHYVPLDPKRKRLGYITLVIFILTFTPVPIQVLGQ